MVQIYFYGHLAKLLQLEDHLQRFELEEEHHQELLHLAYDTLHAEIMHFTLTQLPEERRHEFLKHFSKRPQDEGLLHFLKASIENFEVKIQNIAREVEQKLIDELYDYEEAAMEWMEGANYALEKMQ